MSQKFIFFFIYLGIIDYVLSQETAERIKKIVENKKLSDIRHKIDVFYCLSIGYCQVIVT